MPENQGKFSDFISAGVSDWESAARAELDGKDPWANLTYEAGGLKILPYYDQPAASITLPPDERQFAGPRSWFNCPTVRVSDERLANLEALDHLQHGADGIMFEISHKVDYQTLCQKISWSDCSVNFLNHSSESLAEGLARYLEQNQLQSNALPGAFYGHNELTTQGPFRMAGFNHETHANVAKGIAITFSAVARRISSLGTHPSQIALRVGIEQNFFLSSATLRAMRAVWQRLLRHLNVKEAALHLHADCNSWNNAGYDPHGQLLYGTTAAMAAILGGCNTLTIAPGDPDSPMSVRVARNISNILRYESHLNRVADPLAGSYLVDNLTEQLSGAAWNFLSVEL